MKKVFINSLPKSDTNLLSHYIELFGYTNNGHLGAGVFPGNRWRNILKRIVCTSYWQGYLLGINTPIEVSRKYVDKFFINTNPGMYLSAHVGYTNDILSKITKLGFKNLLITIEPRAVISSFIPYVL